MKKEQFERAKELDLQIKNLERIVYIIEESKSKSYEYKIVFTHYKWNSDKDIDITKDEELFKSTVHVLLMTYKNRLNQLKSEFEKL